MKALTLSLMIAFFTNFIKAQCVFVGARDNNFIYAGYQAEKGFYSILEHSIYIKSFEDQSVKFKFGKTNILSSKHLKFNTYAYGTHSWNNSFWNMGICGTSTYHIRTRFKLITELMYHYDTTLKSDFCYKVGGELLVIKELFLLANYTNMPIFRICETRVNLGVIFNSGNLSVSPHISVPVCKKIEYTRFLFSFIYHYNFNKK